MITPAAPRASCWIPRTRTGAAEPGRLYRGLLPGVRGFAVGKPPRPAPSGPTAGGHRVTRPVRRPSHRPVGNAAGPSAGVRPRTRRARLGCGKITRLREAAEITEKARRARERYLAKCGGAYSSEWYWLKVLHCRRSWPRFSRPPIPGWSWPTSFRRSSRAISIRAPSPAASAPPDTRRCTTRPGRTAQPKFLPGSIPRWPSSAAATPRGLDGGQEGRRLPPRSPRGSACRRA